MWWMYIGLGVVVAFLVIFVFAVLAARSTDIGEPSPRTESRLK
jgi:Na+-transporting methylmalonyl-CoA/oxaloacetate decarboxylase gamma subunit